MPHNAVHTLMALASGTKLGPYEILSTRGGLMREVYRARDARLGREVAIKVGFRALRPIQSTTAFRAGSTSYSRAQSSEHSGGLRYLQPE
jgi:hypothetical protein